MLTAAVTPDPTAMLVQRPPLASGRNALYRPWSQVHLDPLHCAAQTVKLISGRVFQESLVMARDLHPMLSKHFHGCVPLASNTCLSQRPRER
jgi:hypothetical protein